MNPFRHTAPVAPGDLIDRDGESATLLDRAVAGDNSRVVAPRRYGKTSLLRRVLHEAQLEGYATVYVDFFGVLTLADVADRIERAYADQLQGKLATWYAGARRLLRPTVRAGGGPVPVGVEVTLDPQAEPPLLDRLALPRRLYERHAVRSIVVFDEFQDVLSTQSRADATIRSEIQHHGEVASYIFAGSHVGMMRELFADRRRAFFGQAGPVPLPALAPDAVADFVANRFARSDRTVEPGALGPLVDTAAGHPQRSMLLAHALWDATPPGASAGAETWLAAYDRVRTDLREEHRAAWSALGAGQRRVLAAIASNDAALYATARRYGGSRGGAVASAVRTLVDRGEVLTDGAAPTGYRVVDPLLAAWVVAGRQEV